MRHDNLRAAEAVLIWSAVCAAIWIAVAALLLL